MQEIKSMLVERLEHRKKELIDIKTEILPKSDSERCKYFDGKRVMLEGVTGEIPFLEKLIKIISEKAEE